MTASPPCSAAGPPHRARQWLEIGSLLIQDPELTMLDERVAGMSVGEREQTAELLKTQCKHYLDVHIACRQACLNAIASDQVRIHREQAYAILGTAPPGGRIRGVVDITNACAPLAVPTEIFSFDIKPNSKGPIVMVPKEIDLAKAD